LNNPGNETKTEHITCDFARLRDGATEIKCPQSGNNIAANMFCKNFLIVP